MSKAHNKIAENESKMNVKTQIVRLISKLNSQLKK